ncbi:hypothetical protein TVAG_475190 [Trichomonas vaginalis G3]|uniref:Initiator binding domain-containing protein n=1 Tax=Trichomonas vaginalis (strain ATCC PRA-98 / G3) TaxID=412133 RepID=A2EM26_TRIV3|nr:transcription-initiator DNA-binding domain ibd family [Trichomonas vaginalis G3]EAY06285.1 hypothetical protein TVAG_475190 [Trichomonas vaginalis G3]KAI5503363.1 transcription-initiator DNA-binding domain ibd family [Trichomonas vaginalis G3]|eukprot:XP_001318508.1 hypothetical protein [Trichomonas vaginalis G3]
MEKNGGTGVPMYINHLSEIDREAYMKLKNDINLAISTNGRTKFCSLFSEIINKIRKYVVQNDTNDDFRSLVCGIIWMGDTIAINTRQLMCAINKCKSSINSGFQAIGYSTVSMDPTSASNLVRHFPFMKDNLNETRQWTLRRLIKKNKCPTPNISPLISPPQIFESPVTITDSNFEFDPLVVPSSDLLLPQISDEPPYLEPLNMPSITEDNHDPMSFYTL